MATSASGRAAHDLGGGGQVDPDLEQLERVRAVVVEQREHLGVDDAATGGQPLRVAASEASSRAERVGVVDEAAAHVRDRLEASVGMAREPGHPPAMVHPPDRKSTRLNSSHTVISYAVFCLKKKKNLSRAPSTQQRRLPARRQ